MSTEKSIRQMPQISIAETIANTIEGEIISGNFSPGERLANAKSALAFESVRFRFEKRYKYSRHAAWS